MDLKPGSNQAKLDAADPRRGVLVAGQSTPVPRRGERGVWRHGFRPLERPIRDARVHDSRQEVLSERQAHVSESHLLRGPVPA